MASDSAGLAVLLQRPDLLSPLNGPGLALLVQVLCPEGFEVLFVCGTGYALACRSLQWLPAGRLVQAEWVLPC